MNEIISRDITREAYTTFLTTVPHSAFHRLAWLDAVCASYSLRVRFVGHFNGNDLRAVTPLMGLRKGPFTFWGAPARKCNTPPATIFCSPPTEAGNALPALHAWIRKRRLGYVQVTLPQGLADARTYADQIESLDNLELDLSQPLELLWNALAQQRTSVRKAVKSAVRIHWGYRAEILDKQHEVVTATYENQAVPPNIPERLYASLLNRRDELDLRILYATHKGVIIATVWTLCDAGRCYYWDAASVPEARELNANHLLVWCLVRWARQHGFKTLDLVGTSIGGRGGSRPGIGRFKQSMGGRPVAYEIAYWHSPLMKILFACYRRSNQIAKYIRHIRSPKHVRHS